MNVTMELKALQLLIVTELVLLLLKPAAASVSRQDLFANSDGGVRIHIREVLGGRPEACDPILLEQGRACLASHRLTCLSRELVYPPQVM